MDEISNTRDYYEREARLQTRTQVVSRRVELRDEFIELLRSEGRVSVVDFGAGPGLDGAAFVDSGFGFVGVDFAHGNGVLAAKAGVTVVQGSVQSPPLRARSFDAGWSMSTLMHVPETDVAATVRAMAETLVVGAPLFIGLWGGESDRVDDQTIAGHQRWFNGRSLARNRELVANGGELIGESTWPVEERADYQVFRLRVRR